MAVFPSADGRSASAIFIFKSYLKMTTEVYFSA